MEGNIFSNGLLQKLFIQTRKEFIVSIQDTERSCWKRGDPGETIENIKDGYPMQIKVDLSRYNQLEKIIHYQPFFNV